MAVVHQNEEEEEETIFEKTKNMGVVPTTLATFESLTFPLVIDPSFLIFMIMFYSFSFVKSANCGCSLCENRFKKLFF